ncbi:ABC transporter permease subunit [Glycomyces buryatensis]|uniref:ABC transporter permease n=1 Tax=Glycomyces buryatensis TaxID=2570927 RepID=A0A4S8Q725_9ACTN|nr:ABC transporter permease subunit [Glycomyces buryatensis]THV40177.1 ABC transporter permease [Glycomyces buryatensis]
MTALLNTTRAELRRILLWPATWVLGGIWITLQLMFSYAFPFIAYRSNDPDAFQGGPSDQLLASMLPPEAPTIMIQGTPMFGGAIVMIFAALAVGSTYNWGTWKTTLTQGPGRLTTMGGMAAAIGVCLAGLIAISTAVTLGMSSLIAVIESRDIVWPDWGDLGVAVGGTGLVLGMWAAAGLFLGALTRGPALSVGLGLLWTLAVENLLRGAANLIDGFSAVTDVLPGSSAGSLAGALGAASSGSEATPGVLDALTGPTAASLLGIYLVVFLVGTLILIKRRDVA